MENPKPPFRQRLPFKSKKSYLGAILLMACFVVAGIYFMFAGHAQIVQLSKPVTLEGEITILHKDNFKGKKTNERYFITTGDGSKTEIKNVNPDQITGGSKVQATGTLNNSGSLTLSTAVESLQTVQTNVITPTAKKTAVIMYDFDDRRYRPYTAAAVKQYIFTGTDSANKYYKAASLGKLSLTGAKDINGDVYGWYRINKYSTDCGIFDHYETVSKVAAAQGFDASKYDNIILVSPDPGCDAGGLGEVGGKLSWVFVNYPSPTDFKQIAIHELGHNFGFLHAHSLECQNSSGQFVSISNKCENNEYGDFYNPMGYGGFYGEKQKLFGSYYQNQQGWLANSQVKSISASGDYTINTASTPGSGIKTIRIPRRRNQYNNYEYYYIEYRTPYGYDKFISGDAALKGIMIRLSQFNPYGPSYAVAESNILYSNNDFDEAFPVGKTFTDSKYGITIKLNSRTATTANVHITVTNIPKPDITPPPVPKDLRTLVSSTKRRLLRWTNVIAADIDHYNVYKDGVLISKVYCCVYGSTTQLEFEGRSTWPPGMKLVYNIKAVDHAGNASANSNTLTLIVPPIDKIPPKPPTNIIVVKKSGTGEMGTYSYYHITFTKGTDDKFVYGHQVQVKDFETKLLNYKFDIPFYTSSAFDISPCSKVLVYLRTYDSSLNYSTFTSPLNLKPTLSPEYCGAG